MIVWFLHRLLFYEVFKVIVHTNGKLSNGDNLRIQTFREQGLGAKAIISSYPDHKGWKLSFVKKACSRVRPLANNVISVKLILCIFIPCRTVLT